MTTSMKNKETRWPKSLYATGKEPDARVSLANERTALAGIRTALALLAAGIGVAALQQYFDSSVLFSYIAAGLTIAGSLLAIGVPLRWYENEKAMRLDLPLPAPKTLIPIAIFIFMIGIVGVIATVVR